jgi:hypothetical protein
MREIVMTRRLSTFVLTVILLSSVPTRAQETEANLRNAVRTTVDALLKDLGNLNLNVLPDYFTPHAVLIVAREREGEHRNTVETIDRWLKRMRDNPSPSRFEERISNVTITIDNGQLATLRADFEILRDGEAISKGVDVFTLLRDGDTWKVAALAYTNVPAP